MVFKNEDDKEVMVIATCNCGCGSEIHIVKHKEEDVQIPTEYYLSLHSSKFDEEQQGIFTVLWRRLKRAWFNLLGKDYLYMDIVFDETEFMSFIELLKMTQKR